MWYNIIPYFVPMDPNMYSMYYLRIKGFDPWISGKTKGNAINVTQPELLPPIKQPVFIMKGVPIQPTMATTLLVNAFYHWITCLW
jgi:hypothetical protein